MAGTLPSKQSRLAYGVSAREIKKGKTRKKSILERYEMREKDR
jgi:hypothetical protein